jgi:5,10-methylenetetrahydromethanopterin reductase
MVGERLGIGFTGAPYTVREVVELAKLAEKQGYASFWCAEDYFLRDAITNISCVSYATSKIEISTGIVNPFTRNPVLVAETIATLNELSEGRIRLALGTGVQPLIENMGIAFDRPLAAISEAVAIIRELLEGKVVDYSGKVFRTKQVKLGQNPYFDLVETKFKVSPVPIYIAAIGPKMLELAGRIGDGVLFTAGFSVWNVKQAIPIFERGARSSGRSVGALKVGTYIVSSLGEASKEVKGFLAFDVAYSRPENVIAVGIAEQKVATIHDAVMKKGLLAASQLVTDDIVDQFAACGTKGEIQAKVEEFRKAGVSEPILLPMGTDAAELIRSVS